MQHIHSSTTCHSIESFSEESWNIDERLVDNRWNFFTDRAFELRDRLVLTSKINFHFLERGERRATAKTKCTVSGCGRMDDLRESIVTPDDFYAATWTDRLSVSHTYRYTYNTRINNFDLAQRRRIIGGNIIARRQKTHESSAAFLMPGRDPLIASIKKHATTFYSYKRPI